MTPSDLYEFRMRLAAEGIRFRAAYPPGVSPIEANGAFHWPPETVSASGLAALSRDFASATDTVLLDARGQVIEVISPDYKTPSELAALAAQIQEAAIALERDRKAAHAARERKRKEAIRRARGCQTRAEYLRQHGGPKPWVALNVSKATYYRRRGKTGAVGG